MEQKFPQSTDLESCVSTLLLYTRKITDLHMDQREKDGKPREWSFDSQIARMHEEVTEVYRANRKDEGKARIIHEALDVMFATFTLFMLDEDILFGDVDAELQNVCKKLEDRYST